MSVRRPKVALVAHGIHDYGGMERVFYELIKRAHDRVGFVVFSAELSPDLRDLVRWRRIIVPMRPISVKTPAFFVEAGAWIARERFDLVHTLGAIAPACADLASVQFCHAGHREATGSLGPPEAPILRRLNTTLARRIALAAERRCYRPERVRVLAAVSHGVARELRRHYPGVPVELTPNGVDTARFRRDAVTRELVRNEHLVAEGEVVSLFVGGDWDHKGVDLAIEGLAIASRASLHPLRLWIVGAGDERRFSALARRLGVAEKVTFLGRVKATERMYCAADLFVIPSRYETFSLAAHEAAASELPVVATRVSGIEDLIGEGEAGAIVERNAEAVGRAIATFVADPGLRARLGEAGRRRVEELTWERSTKSVIALYDALLEVPRP